MIFFERILPIKDTNKAIINGTKVKVNPIKSTPGASSFCVISNILGNRMEYKRLKSNAEYLIFFKAVIPSSDTKLSPSIYVSKLKDCNKEYKNGIREIYITVKSKRSLPIPFILISSGITMKAKPSTNIAKRRMKIFNIEVSNLILFIMQFFFVF